MQLTEASSKNTQENHVNTVETDPSSHKVELLPNYQYAFDANAVQNLIFHVTWTDLSIVLQSITMVKIQYNRHFT